MQDTVINLMKKTTSHDLYGNQILNYTPKQVFARQRPIKQSEYYRARTLDINPEYLFEIPVIDYEEEEMLQFNEQQYTIYRVYVKKNEWIELYCTKDIGNG